MKTTALVLAALTASIAIGGCNCTGNSGSNAGATGGVGSGAAATAAAPEPTLTQKASKLQNGLAVDLSAGDCGDQIALAVHLGVGIDNDPEGRSGMVNLIGRILATTAPAGKAARTVETGSDFTVYTITAAAEPLIAELDDAAAWMTKPTATEADFDREKKRLLDDIGQLAGNNAAATAKSLAEEAVVPTRGNGKRLGVAKEVEAITFAELTAFWQAHVAAGNARIAVAGAFDVEKVRAKIETAFGGLPAGSPPNRRTAGEATVKGTLVMGETPKAVAIAVPAPEPKDPLFAPFLVLAARLVEKPATPRTWEAHYDPLKRPEVLLITGPVGDAEQAEPAAARMRAEAGSALSAPVTADDVTRAYTVFGLFLEPELNKVAMCKNDARAFAVGRARRTLAAPPPPAITVTADQQREAAALFDAKHSAAVIAGGAIR
ncbi:MAG: insulinase family protein [Polyangiaceae bacterium]|nr:insulinase family protein [Polyangiaceae bacterium]